MEHDLQTDCHDEALVVFILGMTPRSVWRWGQAVFVARALFRMRSELERDRAEGDALGYLGGFTALGRSGPVVVQYWRSFDELETYAHDPLRTHRPAWLRFYAKTHADGARRVGIWHETFQVPTRSHESIYADLRSPVGLGAAVGTQDLLRRGRASRDRITAVSSARPASTLHSVEADPRPGARSPE